MLSRLDGRERQILVSHFGLEGAEVLTLAQLGTELGITRQRVLQIESRARAKLRTLVLREFPLSTLGESSPCV
jgi:DNA-directed RNA polymerase sigma subunit (sigma70/sigma32)